MGQVNYEIIHKKLIVFIYDCTYLIHDDEYKKTTKDITRYVGSTYNYGINVNQAIDNLKLPTLDITDALLEKYYDVDRHMWDNKVN